MISTLLLRVLLAGALGAWLWAGCAPPRFDIKGGSRDMDRFAGRWEGTYSSSAGRSGTIEFWVQPEGNTARGKIIMIPRGWAKPLGMSDEQARRDRPDLLHELHFSEMILQGDRVEGRLETYRDPDCGCDLDTSFDGLLRRDRIEGTFRSHEVGGDEEYRGVWTVERRP